MSPSVAPACDTGPMADPGAAALADGTYDALVVDAEESGNGAMGVELTIVAGPAKGEVVTLVAPEPARRPARPAGRARHHHGAGRVTRRPLRALRGPAPRGGGPPRRRPRRRPRTCPRPEEAPQPVLGVAGHDVDVEVGHALADPVVHGHERALGAEPVLHGPAPAAGPGRIAARPSARAGRPASRGGRGAPAACGPGTAAARRGRPARRRRRARRGPGWRPATISQNVHGRAGMGPPGYGPCDGVHLCVRVVNTSSRTATGAVRGAYRHVPMRRRHPSCSLRGDPPRQGAREVRAAHPPPCPRPEPGRHPRPGRGPALDWPSVTHPSTQRPCDRPPACPRTAALSPWGFRDRIRPCGDARQ